MVGMLIDTGYELLEKFDTMRVTDLHVPLFILVCIDLHILCSRIGQASSSPVNILEYFWQKLVVLYRLEVLRRETLEVLRSIDICR